MGGGEGERGRRGWKRERERVEKEIINFDVDVGCRGEARLARLALHQAATHGHVAIVEYLLNVFFSSIIVFPLFIYLFFLVSNNNKNINFEQAGFPVDYELPPSQVTALCLAAETGKVDTVTLLLKRGADPNKVFFFFFLVNFLFKRRKNANSIIREGKMAYFHFIWHARMVSWV
jgi:hypothetical protein